MSNARFFSAIALTAVVSGTLVAGVTLSRPALAEAPPSPVCIQVFNATVPSTNAKWEAWIGEQVAAGRTHFVSHPVGVCAW